MGEYAMFNGSRVKIGTCEDMYYLRWDQRRLVRESETPLFDEDVLKAIRFRFPFPDEDGTEPGAFEDFGRGFRLYGFEAPAEVEHGSVQFSAPNGYLLLVPCPEGSEAPAGIMRNGYGGSASLVQQAWRGGRLVGIARCNGCGAAYRLEDGAEHAASASIRATADAIVRNGRADCVEGDALAAARVHEVADRLLAGYHVTVTA